MKNYNFIVVTTHVNTILYFSLFIFHLLCLLHLYAINYLLHKLGNGHAVKLSLCGKSNPVGKDVWSEEVNVIRGDEIPAREDGVRLGCLEKCDGSTRRATDPCVGGITGCSHDVTEVFH